MPYDASRHGAYKDAYDFHFEQNRNQAQQWVDRLKREYYDDGNAVGTTKLFDAVKALHPAPGSHPTKRFVREWLRRQAGHQLTTRPSRKRGSDIHCCQMLSPRSTRAARTARQISSCFVLLENTK
eukprot:COSAG02_NODE_473_length_21601_cov_136.065994_3_plen_125_part_00